MASKKNLKRELRQERARIVELEAEKEGLSEQLRRTRRHLTGCQAQLADEQSRSRYATSEQAHTWAFNNDVVLVSRQAWEEIGKHADTLPVGITRPMSRHPRWQ